jgi:hypothetical protein
MHSAPWRFSIAKVDGVVVDVVVVGLKDENKCRVRLGDAQ